MPLDHLPCTLSLPPRHQTGVRPDDHPGLAGPVPAGPDLSPQASASGRASGGTPGVWPLCTQAPVGQTVALSAGPCSPCSGDETGRVLSVMA